MNERNQIAIKQSKPGVLLGIGSAGTELTIDTLSKSLPVKPDDPERFRGCKADTEKGELEGRASWGQV
jgi:hypothetical protein